MKITDAFWEIRNLGVTAQEMEIEADDPISWIRDQIRGLSAAYQVIRVGNARLDVYALLSELGFSLAEASIQVTHELKDLQCPARCKRFCDEITFDIMDENDVLLMQKQIEGGMFKTDRITLDPYFTREQAARRYVMWMKDEVTRGSILFNYRFRGEPAGFTCMKKIGENRICPVLGGIYDIGRPLPIGSSVVFKQLEIGRNLGRKELITIISANNTAAMKVYSQLGYVFNEIKYVFIKHCEASA